VKVGDWVRVVSVPDSAARMPRESKRTFSRAVGNTFQIEAFDGSGCAELDLSGKIGRDTIWIEPFCVRRVRRPRKQSLRFRRILAIRRRLERPRWSFRYVGKYRRTNDPVKLGAKLQTLAEQRMRCHWSHGWYVIDQKAEIHGTFSAQDRRASSRRQLEQLRKDLAGSDLSVSLHVGRIRLRT
jgi:hypothetical protein